jgi:spore maturation protein CgeB
MLDKELLKFKSNIEQIKTIAYKHIAKDIKVSILKKDWLLSYKEELIDLNRSNLEIDVNTEGKHLYLCLAEDNPKFVSPPTKNNLKIFAGEKYTFEYEAKIEDGLNAILYFIGYSSDKKIQQELIVPGEPKNIVVDPMCEKYRLAIRFSGSGVYRLKKINIKLDKDNLEEKNSNRNLYQSEIYINSKKISKEIKDIKDLNIACIFDEFSMESFSKECKLITFTQNNWFEIFEKENPDILFVESAWRGNNNAWQYKIAKYNNQDKTQLENLIQYCKYKNIPTIFWNKEDPIHFEKFIDTAKLFDYIFTTDRNMISKYKELANNENVYSMPFSAQPKSHNPIKSFNRENGVCFAGSYYGNRHQDRKNDMDEVLEICKDYNLSIFDRNYEATKQNSKSPFRFPDKFQTNIKGTLKYNQIDKAYKGYKVMLNVNSVKYSPTMFSRRVFEGMACGTPIVSTYSQGIDEMFGEIVICNEDNKNTAYSLEKLITDELTWKKASLKGIRKVMLNHTYSDRLRYVLSKVGIYIKKQMPKVSMISLVNSLNDINEAVKIFKQQSYSNKELILIMKTNFDGYIQALNNYNKDDIKCYIGEYIENNYLNIKELVNSDYFAYINLENIYGENYLLDLILATIYTDAKIIGKKSYYTYDNNSKDISLVNSKKEYLFVNDIDIDNSLIYIDVFEKTSLQDTLKLLDNKNSLEYYFNIGNSMFSIDNNNFIKNGKIDLKYINNKNIEKIFI